MILHPIHCAALTVIWDVLRGKRPLGHSRFIARRRLRKVIAEDRDRVKRAETLAWAVRVCMGGRWVERHVIKARKFRATAPTFMHTCRWEPRR